MHMKGRAPEKSLGRQQIFTIFGLFIHNDYAKHWQVSHYTNALLLLDHKQTTNSSVISQSVLFFMCINQMSLN